MFTQNPDATPIWLLIIFSGVFYFGYPIAKRLVAKYSSNKTTQSFWALLIMLVIGAIIVSLSMLIE